MTRRSLHALRSMGFDFWRSGGNCSALRRDYPDGTYHLVTVLDDPRAPFTDTEPCRLGMWRDGADAPIADDCEFDNVTDVALLFASTL